MSVQKTLSPLFFLVTIATYSQTSKTIILKLPSPSKIIGNQKIIKLYQADSLIILTGQNYFAENMQAWMLKNPNITKDKDLFEKINTHSQGDTILANIVADTSNLSDRLLFRTSDLLENKKCVIYNTKSKSFENTILLIYYKDFGKGGRKFNLYNKTFLITTDWVE